jgi:hypothetical protein
MKRLIMFVTPLEAKQISRALLAAESWPTLQLAAFVSSLNLVIGYDKVNVMLKFFKDYGRPAEMEEVDEVSARFLMYDIDEEADAT